MTTALRTFTFEAFPIRTVQLHGEPWFVARDACAILDLANVGQAIASLWEDEKRVLNHGELVGLGICNRDDLEITRLALVSEAGLYALIFKSQKPAARAFQHWITAEVLPSIRRTGQYTTPAPHGQVVPFQVPKTLAQALRLAADQAEQLEHQAATIQVLQPKAAFHDAVHDGQGAQSIREVAQVLGTGQNRLFAWLRHQRILLENNLPYQEHLDAGRFKVVETTWTDRDGCTHPTGKTLVTGEGLTWLQAKWQAWKAGEGAPRAEVS